MTDAAVKGQFAEELAELHDGSISLFVTLPVFRSLLVSEQRASALQAFESLIAEHLAHLDGILGDVLVRRDRSDGHLTASLFRSIAELRLRPASPQRPRGRGERLEQGGAHRRGGCQHHGVCVDGRGWGSLLEKVARLAIFAPKA